MIRALFVSLALALALQALAPAPARAVSLPECQAFLCMPGGFPPSECTPAKAAVLRRLAALQPALPSWSSCASQFGWDSANVSHTERRYDRCPRGGTLTIGRCRGINAAGCAFSYAPQKKVTVQVSVDGATNFSPNHTLTHTLSPPGPPVITCPPPPPPILTGGGDDDTCATPPCDDPGDGDDDTCANPPCDDPGDGDDDTCANPPCDDPGDGDDDTCANPPCDDPGDGDDDTCAAPVPIGVVTGGPPAAYRVSPGCPCPSGHQLRHGNLCLSSTFTPVN